VPCSHCGASQTLEWRQVKWDKTDEKEGLAETATYQCGHCGVLWSDAERWSAVSRGEWRASRPFAGIAGFHLSQLYSPWIALSAIIREFLAAQGHPELLKVFSNTVLGETWAEEAESVNAHGIRGHVENYGPSDLPDGVHYATLGGDVQADRIEVEIVGWGAGDESWGIVYEVIYGDPARAETWAKVDEIRRQKFWTTEGRLVRVRAACIDTGGHHAAHVIGHCRARFREGVYPIKGASGPRPVWPKRASKSANTRENIWLIGVDTAKDAIYGRFRIAWTAGERAVPGYCHLPPDYDDDWFEQVTSESVVTRYKEGRPYRVWVLPPGRRNEALDCRLYAYAARMSLEQTGDTKPSTVRVDHAATAQALIQAAEPKTSRPILILPPPPRGRRMRSMGID
jgi:phage terminase large subunit GpA-like protein